jgi:energy-coupling factor transporter ATP-binding protein EcfA2
MLRYSDLIQFEPIESVVQLRDADDKERAFHLLDTYVISDRMAEQLDDIIIEQIQFDRIVDNKGLLIVGNYGTGKSHLMSVISTIAEQPGASKHIKNERVAKKATEIEGKFKVIRTEIGAVAMSLRDIICQALQQGLANLGIDYTFPKASEVTNNKDMLYEMMELFHDQYPDLGLMLVVDELLDYLRSRKEQDLTLDLGFLREFGEVCSKTRLRFIAGIQEMLFDNPKFQFVADSLRRVKERFQEVRIIREDIAYVVSERLLKKDEKQKAFIREHLSKFTSLYHRLGEDMETYVNLFPIHPAYLETFEKVNIAEKRVVLQTISKEIRKLLTEEVPDNETGMISFDNYWQYIEEDSSLKSNPDVKEVMGKVQTLKDRVQNGLKRPTYKPAALRIVNALAVYRLATDDINAPVGLTSEELRDKLFLNIGMLLDLGDEAADFLKTTIESVLKEIMTAVSFQYISTNQGNGQYYLDIKKDIAVDELIEKRGEELTDNQLDRYYFEILKQATEVTDNTYVTGYKIWLHEIPWEDRRVKRQGYLFFGAPNERSTAQPERDFYIYMLQPFEPPKFKDEEKADEVFFRMTKKDGEFIRLLRLYGGAREMSNDASTTKHLYNRKVEMYLKRLTTWLKENFVEAFEIQYRGKKGSILEFGMFLPGNATLIEIIDAVADGLLSQWFEEKYKDYPSFRKIERGYLTKDNIVTYVSDALSYLNGKITSQGEAILNGLVLLDQKGKLNVRGSGYARWVIEKLEEKGRGQVLNQNELIETVYTVQGTEDIRLTKEFRMEPELLVVLLGALIQQGEIVVTVDNKTYEAMNFGEFIKLPLSKLTHFSHIKKPSGLPIPAINALIDMFDIGKGNATDEGWLDFAIQRIISQSRQAVEKTVKMINDIRNNFQIWDGPLFSSDERAEYIAKLESLKTFLEGLQVYNTRAKMTNLKYSMSDIEQQNENLKIVTKLEQLQQKIHEYTKVADYLSKAKLVMSTNREWLESVDVALDNLAIALKENSDCSSEMRELEKLKEEYIQHYLQLHHQARLNATEENKKKALLNDKRYFALKELVSRIDLLPRQALDEWNKNIQSLKSCYQLTREHLQHDPICPYCKFNPRDEAMVQRISLEQLEERLDDLLNTWTETLLTNFNDSAIQEGISLLSADQQQLVKDFIEKKQFDLPIDIRLLEVMNDLLKGIHKEEIHIDQLVKMMGDGNPLTVGEVRKNFEMLMRAIVGNNQPHRVRIMVKK